MNKKVIVLFLVLMITFVGALSAQESGSVKETQTSVFDVGLIMNLR
ncbi:MAG TPA: hypothetical protein VJ869_11945 [Sphaerochaeta sp.]|nr:hypothetical protein [Sphaerochaeta sp.]